jgi:hypothetical protein
MSKKVLPNRISKTVSADALTRVRGAIQVFQEVLGADTRLSETEYKSLRKIATKLKQEKDEVFAIAQENPELTEPPFALDEMAKDKAFYECCEQIRALLEPILLKLDREQNLAGAEYANACSLFEEHIALKVERGHPKAQYIKLQLNRMERYRPSSSSPKTES